MNSVLSSSRWVFSPALRFALSSRATVTASSISSVVQSDVSM